MGDQARCAARERLQLVPLTTTRADLTLQEPAVHPAAGFRSQGWEWRKRPDTCAIYEADGNQLVARRLIVQPKLAEIDQWTIREYCSRWRS